MASMPKPVPSIRRRKGLLVGVRTGKGDGHTRVSRGPDFVALGGDREGHEHLRETVAEIRSEVGRRGRELGEVRRFLGMPLKLERVEPEAFDALLRQTYESGSNAAMQMVEGFDDTTDLAHLAQELPEPSDLLESEDDAPVIRLINAVLTVPGRWRAARSTPVASRCGAARGLAHQGHVEARHRGKALATGRSHQLADCGPRGGRACVDDSGGAR